LLLAAQPIAAMAFWPWLSIGVGVFVFGWVLQFIGHYYEGKTLASVRQIWLSTLMLRVILSWL